jgi:SNF2 family DNA or RNA helicase
MSDAAQTLSPIKAPTTTGFARVVGTFLRPALLVHIHTKLPHPKQRQLSMLDWVKSLGTARWQPQEKAWLVLGMNSADPESILRDAGVELEWDTRPEEFADTRNLAELTWPIAKLADNKRTVLVRPRFAGFDYAKELIGAGSVWDKDREFFRMPVGDILVLDSAGAPVIRPHVHWPQDAIDAAWQERTRTPVAPELASAAAALSGALDVGVLDAKEMALFQSAFGDFPEDGREPFAYQRAGALAVAAGRGCLFDEPGVGKTAQALLAARLLGAKRTIVVVPPLLITNWRREIELSALCAEDNIAVFKPSKKEPALPESGAVIISDSLLASRRSVLDALVGWSADVMIVDESHRIKTIGSSRGEAVLDLGQSIKYAPIALTGTPIFASPHEMVTILELTRMIGPVFGGRHQFLMDFCYQDQFGGWKPRKTALPRLYTALREHVWVRRRKRDVAPQLPLKVRNPMILDVPLKNYREAHKEVISKIQGFLTWFTEQNGKNPTQDDIQAWIQFSSFTLISQLRQAAGLAKIPAAVELIENHFNETGFELDERGRRVFNRPLLVWVHHKSVAAAMAEALPTSIGETGLIGGATSDSERDRLVDQFQEGLIPVLVCSITKAGVGLTLTRSQDAIFVETDWTPAVIKQAEDRQHRHGATAESINYTTLIAADTLDEPIQRVLGRKMAILESAIGDTDDSVALLIESDTRGIQEIVAGLVDTAITTWKPTKKP